MSWAAEAQRAWQARTSEELARAWIGRIVERTPLAELGDLDVGWLGREALPLIDALLAELNAPRPAPGPLSASAAGRVRALAGLRRGGDAALVEVPRDIALLQGLLADALARNDQEAAEAGPRSELLFRLFGEVNAAFAQALVAEREAAGPRVEVAEGVDDEAALHEELARLAAGNGSATPFAILELDVDGLRHLNHSAGVEEGDRLLQTVADVAATMLGPEGRLFRREGDELVAVVPGSGGPAAAALATRIREAVAAATGTDAPGSPVSIGVAAWPSNASDPAHLLERAREATYVAKSSGQGIALAQGEGSR